MPVETGIQDANPGIYRNNSEWDAGSKSGMTSGLSRGSEIERMGICKMPLRVVSGELQIDHLLIPLHWMGA